MVEPPNTMLSPSGADRRRPGDEGSRVKRLRGRISALPVLVFVVAAGIVLLLLVITWISIRQPSTSLGPTTEVTLGRYGELFGDPSAYQAARNTVVFSAWTLFWAMLFGVSIAWLTERTNLGGKRTIYTLMIIGVLIPGFFTAMGWVFLAHPRIGIINQLATTAGIGNVVDIVSLHGMGWVQGLSLTSVVFVLTSSSLRSMDASLEEAAATSGAGFLTTMRRVTLPLAWPGLLGAAIFTLTIAIGTFDVPLIIGQANRIQVFSTFLYSRVQPSEELPQYGTAAAFSVAMIVLGLLLAWQYTRVLQRGKNYQVITGKNYKPKIVELGRWRLVAIAGVVGYFVLSKLLPILMVIWTSLIPFLQVPSPDAFGTVSLANYRGIIGDLFGFTLRNTIILMVTAPTITILLAIAFSWVILRSRAPGKIAYDYVAFLTQAVPTIVFAFAAFLITVNMKRPVDLYGTLVIIILVQAVTQLAFATRMTNSSLIQVSDELEEAGQTSGASLRTIMRRITVPLILPSILTAWLWMAMLAFRELTIPMVLFARNNMTLSVQVFNLWRTGEIGQAAATTVVMLLILIPLIVVYWWVTHRRAESRN